jgi:hypothetical protein
MDTQALALMAEASIWDREPNWRRGPPEWDVIDRENLLVWSGPLPERTDGRCVYLKGAGTRKDVRGRGIYSSVTDYRCARAVERGCRHASIIALADTSAPILRTRGFIDLGPLPRYLSR